MRFLSLSLLFLSCAAPAAALDILYAHLAFKSSDGKPYVESQVCVLNRSLHFVSTGKKNSYQAAYRIQLHYINGTDTLAQHDYTLRSPAVIDPTQVGYDLIDIRRTALPAGTYRIALKVQDLNGPDVFEEQRDLALYFPTQSLAFSSPLLVRSYEASDGSGAFHRAGFSVVPYPVAFFPESMQKLTVYYEVYNAASTLDDTLLVLQYGLRTQEGTDVPGYQFTMRQRADTANVFFSSVDISSVEAGRYEFYLQATNRRAEPLGGTRFMFTRARKSADGFKEYEQTDIQHSFAATLDSDSLMMWLGGLYHLTTNEGKRILADIEKSKDSLLARKFIHRFMVLEQSHAPAEAWEDYRATFANVEYHFATPVRRGYETDRGRVFMQYGPPNQRNISTSEPGAYPYEVWQYYRIPGGQTNVYFIFYLPGLATNDFKLIHSTARGELQDVRWRMKIYPHRDRSRRSANPDNTGVKDHFGKRIDDFLPR